MPRSPKRKPRIFRTVLLLLITALVVGGVLAAAGIVPIPDAISKKFAGSGSSATTKYLLDTAARGPFRITVRERGTVDSLKSVTLTSKVEGTTTIISLVPEGTQVKEGDLLVELDASSLVETEKTQVIAVTQAEAALTKAQEGLAIQERQNDSDIAAAELALLLAKLDLNKYLEGEYPQLAAEQEGLVQVAREDRARYADVYEFSQRLHQKGYTSQSALEADRIALAKSEVNLKAAEDKLRVLKDYTKQRTIAELEANAKEAERALERVKRQGEAALAQFKADVDAAKLTLDVEKEKLERARTQIANSKIYAPQAGEVIYAIEDRGRGDQEDVIKEGATIRERKAIIELPDLSQMKVDARIHESLVSRVRPGLPARIRIDAVPGKIFRGKVMSVSSVPVDGDWMRPDLKEYSCIVSIEYTPGEDTQLKPGLTAEVEIIVQERANVLQVPFQSIVTAGNTRYAYVLENGKAERRELSTGASNDTHVEILDGVGEGEKVILNPRTHFSDELAALGSVIEDAKPGEAGDPASAEQEGAAGDPVGGPSPGGAPGPGLPGGGPQASGEGGSGGPQAPGGGSGFDPAQFFARLDKNSDGGVTKDEVEGTPLAERFDTIDANKDGKIEKSEFSAAPRGGRRPGGPGGVGPGAGAPGGGAGAAG